MSAGSRSICSVTLTVRLYFLVCSSLAHDTNYSYMYIQWGNKWGWVVFDCFIHKRSIEKNTCHCNLHNWFIIITSVIMEFLSFDPTTKELALDSCAIPKPKDDQVLIKVAYSGICGTDLHILDVGKFQQVYYRTFFLELTNNFCYCRDLFQPRKMVI